MRTWKELEADFRQLDSQMPGARLDIQWGHSGDHAHLAGHVDQHARHRFDTLARMAGRKLKGLPTNPPMPVAGDDHYVWMLALRTWSGAFQHDAPGQVLGSTGEALGWIYLGRMERPAEASANLCLRIESLLSPAVPTPVRDRLAGPGWEGALSHWERSVRLLEQEEPDLANAVKEAVCSLEAVAKVVAETPSATLGESLKELRKSGYIAPALAACLERLWGFVNEAPGVRHGSVSPVDLTRAEADFVLTTAEAAIRLLIETRHAV